MTDSPSSAQTFTFKAETKQLLNILIHSLYKDREVFLRELLSNATDALNRLRFTMLTEQNVLDKETPLAIRIHVDKDARLLTIEDSGIGMTRQELMDSLGTIAQSGARKFMQAAQQTNTEFSRLIGQFGVGFYSVFMVADWVRVTSRSYKPEESAASWYATGEDEYQIEAAEMPSRGTKIEIHLKEDAEEFAEEYRLRNIIQKHSDYIGFPITLGAEEKPINKQTSLWRTPRSEITPEQYQDFYRQQTLEFEEPLLSLHSVSDAPVQLYALLFVPAKGERGVFSLRKEDGLKLYSRNILIDEYNKDLLPEYLRFVQGVVDSEDLPLNVSRETVQSSGLMPRLKKVVTNALFKELEALAKNDPEKYQTFWLEFGNYLKQGIASNAAETEKIQSLLRFHTTQQPETWSSLEEYTARMPESQKTIYYLVGEDLQTLRQSPHLDAFTAQNIEVLLLTDAMDSFMLMGLHQYKDYPLQSASTADLPESPAAPDAPAPEKMPEPDLESLLARFRETLGEKVQEVRPSARLSQSLARLVDPEGAPNPELQRVYKYLGKEFETSKKILELNPAHPLLKSLPNLAQNPGLQTLLIEQIYESALLAEGLHPNPAGMVERVQKIMEAALQANA